jgi:hypothetical protein
VGWPWLHTLPGAVQRVRPQGSVDNTLDIANWVATYFAASVTTSARFGNRVTAG